MSGDSIRHLGPRSWSYCDNHVMSASPHVVARLVAVGCAAVVAALLLSASTIPNLVFSDNVIADTAIRKVGHFFAFFVIGMLVSAGASGWMPRRRATFVAIAVASLVAIGDEVRQADIPSRIASPLDIAIDLAGALAGVVALDRYRGSRPGRTL